jgi:hypothetical protein
MWESLAQQVALDLISVPGVAEARVDVNPISADAALLVVRFIDVIDGPTQFAYFVRRRPTGNGKRGCS